MKLKLILTICQLVISIFLILSILLQSRGASVSSIFGGTGNVYRVRRGIERFLFILTIVLVCLFVILAILNLWITRK